jgi:hypothetical protein
MGIVVRDMLRTPEKFNGKEIALGGEMMPPKELVQKFGKTTGRKARLETKSFEELRKSKTMPGR